MFGEVKAQMDVPLIAQWQRLRLSQAEMARAEGVSVRTLQRWLKERRDELELKLKLRRNELPWVEIIGGQQPGLHYNLRDDAASDLPSGPFLIGTSSGRVRIACSSDDTSRTKTAKPKSKAKFRPKIRGKKHKPAAKVGSA